MRSACGELDFARCGPRGFCYPHEKQAEAQSDWGVAPCKTEPETACDI